MAYSIQTAVSDGTLEVLDLSIKYMDKSHIFVYVDDVLVDGSAYSYVWLTDTRIQVVPAVANGSTLKVIRKTLTDEMWHEFSKGARFSTSSMDENFEQLLFLAQEYSEGIYISDFYTDLDMHLHRLINLADPVNDKDAVNLQTLKDFLPYGEEAVGLATRLDAEEAHTATLKSAYGSSLVGAATYAQLRAYTGDATRIQIGGRSNYFDGCGGIAVRTGSKPDNDGTVWVDALGRSWERQFSGAADVRWFGAKGDGIADDTAAVQAAVDSGYSICQQNGRSFTFKLSSTVKLFGGGRSYDFDFATFTTDSTFPAFSHKTFSANTGPNSGQHFNLRNLYIKGNAANKYNTNGAGFKVLKDTSGVGYAIYDGTFENIVVQDMYYGFDDMEQSGLWMTKFKHVKFINCPNGFAKSVGTTISFENVYALGGHRGFLLDKIYGFDMIACAADAGTDYDPTFLQQRVLITASEGSIHSLRMEQQAAKADSIFRVDNSKLNIGVISLSNATMDATANSVYAMKFVNSDINLSKIASGVAVAVTGANSSAVVLASGSNVDLTNCALPAITGTSVFKLANFNSRVFGYGLKSSEVSMTSGYMQKDQQVTLYVSSTGNDANSGLTTSNPLNTMAGVFATIRAYYTNHAVTVVLQSSTTFQIDGANNLQLRKLVIQNGSGITGSLQFNVSGGMVAQVYGPTEIVLNVTGLSISGSPGSFANGIIFPSARQDLDYSLDSVQIKAGTITLPANGCITGCALFGYNGMMSVGVRDSAITGASTTTSYICYMTSGTAQVTRGGGSITTCGVTNGTQISTSNLYYA